eukprot:m.39339 g.39339  ORF g.39339 m.39339 type:complete len:267 (-) comp5785_c0_seq1:98-898(-)
MDPHTLTDEERGWCEMLRDKLEEEGVPLPSTDYFLAQYAIVSKSNWEKGVKRVKAYNRHVIQGAKYDSDAALDGTLPGLGFYNRKWPGCIDICGPTGTAQHPTIVFNCAQYRPSDVDPESELNPMIVDKMLLYDALTADLNDIRSGCHVINQAKGAGLHNFCRPLEKKLSVVSQDAYPLKYTRMPVVDAGVVVNVLARVAKPFLRPKLRERIVVCSTDSLYKDHGYETDNLPEVVGGVRVSSADAYEEEIRARLARRAESIAKVVI